MVAIKEKKKIKNKLESQKKAYLKDEHIIEMNKNIKEIFNIPNK